MVLVEKTDQTEAAGEIGLVDIVHMAGPGVPRRPEIDLLAVLERNPGEQAEALPALSQDTATSFSGQPILEKFGFLTHGLNRHSPDNLQTHGDCTQIASPLEWFFLRNGLTARFW